MAFPRWLFAMFTLIGTGPLVGIAQVPMPSLPATPSSTTAVELHAFLAGARAAEANPDKMQRCLAYPDPPETHWSRTTVEAYCRFLYSPTLTAAQIRDLVMQGQSAGLDRRLGELLKAQQTRIDSRDLLDRIYANAFTASANMRSAVDRWKHDSPDSAFAFAASGALYVDEAFAARGHGTIGETSQDQINAMDSLIERAKADLDKAVAIDPHVTPAYVAMIEAGGLDDSDYAMASAKSALANAPTDYSIRSQLNWLAQPKWGGSAEAVQSTSQDAVDHSADNPLFLLLQNAPAALAIDLDDCGCHSDADPGELRKVFDQVGDASLMAGAGTYAASKGRADIAVIYLSEALRFGSGTIERLGQRNVALLDLGEMDMALESANREVQLHPEDERVLQTRAVVYSRMRDQVHVESDMLKILSITKDDLWALTQLGYSYVFNTHEWDKALAISDRLIKEYPDKPDGWFLRAHILAATTQPGLKETVGTFVTRFGKDPDQYEHAEQLKRLLNLPRQAH